MHVTINHANHSFTGSLYDLNCIYCALPFETSYRISRLYQKMYTKITENYYFTNHSDVLKAQYYFSITVTETKYRKMKIINRQIEFGRVKGEKRVFFFPSENTFSVNRNALIYTRHAWKDENYSSDGTLLEIFFEFLNVYFQKIPLYFIFCRYISYIFVDFWDTLAIQEKTWLILIRPETYPMIYRLTVFKLNNYIYTSSPPIYFDNVDCPWC